jgi:hypothetical protein
MQRNLGNSTAMVFEENKVEGDGSGDDDDGEIVHSNDDFEMSHTPVHFSSASQANVSSISLHGSIGKRQ